MPYLSEFTPLGHLELGSDPAPGERFFEALKASLGGQYSTEPGSRMDGHLYAQAMGLADELVTLERAGAQADPHRVYENLPAREGEYGLVPAPGDTIPARRRALAARMLLPGGASRVNVEAALRELLGDDFVAYRPTPKTEAAVHPPSLGDQPMNLQPATAARKLIRLTRKITTGLGAPQLALYERVVPLPAHVKDAPVLLAGDKLVVHPESDALMERVEVLWSGVVILSESSYALGFTAVFDRPHPAGVVGTTAPFPYWVSTKRQSLVVLRAGAAADPEKRRRVHELMRRIARGVSTWSIAAASAPGFAGPFKLGVGKLGSTPIGTVAI